MDIGGIVAIDSANSRTYAVLSPAHGGNTFTLFTFDPSCNRIAEQVLWPTPDLQGPSGLTFFRHRTAPASDPGTLLAFLPPIDGPWELVAIDPRSGAVAATNAARGLPALHLFDSGAIFLAPRPAGNGSVLHVALASGPGMPSRIFGIDVICALSPSVHPPPNCTLSNRVWPPRGHKVAPIDLALYSPPTAVRAKDQARRARVLGRAAAADRAGGTLPSLNLMHTVSGVSSGGGAAANHFVAFSRSVIGVGIIAGNPYGCGAPGVLPDPAKSCSYNVPSISLEALWACVVLLPPAPSDASALSAAAY